MSAACGMSPERDKQSMSQIKSRRPVEPKQPKFIAPRRRRFETPSNTDLRREVGMLRSTVDELYALVRSLEERVSCVAQRTA